MNDYRPISCSFHDRLESFAVLRVPCRIVFLDADGTERECVARIHDVRVRDGAEYLLVDGGPEIRLDRLRSVERADS